MNRSNLNKEGGRGSGRGGKSVLEISFIVNAYTEYYYTWDSEIKY